MRKLLLGIGAVALLAIGGFAGVVAVRPSTLATERSVTVAAKPSDVYPYANDFDGWMKWNPWKDLDPDQKVTFSEPRSGVGAWYEWQGNDTVGRGKMTIRETTPDSRVVWDLAFIEPFASNATVTMLITAEGDGSRVTWAFTSEQDFAGRAFGLLFDMESMLGKDFEKGLARLAPMVEADAEVRRRVEAEAAEVAASAAAEAPLAAEVPAVDGHAVGEHAPHGH